MKYSQDKIVRKSKNGFQNFKDFHETMKRYKERDVQGVEHARWIDVNCVITDPILQAFAVVRNPGAKLLVDICLQKKQCKEEILILHMLTQDH